MAITIDLNHKEEAKALLLQQFKNKANIEGTLDSLIDEIQDGENVFEQLLNERSISTAVGDQLDILGVIVGEPRQGKADADYRIDINGRILLNKSSGTIPEILNLVRNITSKDVTADINIQENFPAGFFLHINESLGSLDPQIVFNIVDSARAAGVGFGMIFAKTTPVFRFSDTAGEAFSTSDISGDGGYWASFLGET